MILPGTYANGFAPRDGEPLFPELWRGCVGAWNPGLGPSGLTLRDWSPYKRHGAVTNMTADNIWKVFGSLQCLDFNPSAGTGWINCGSIPELAVGASDLTVLAWSLRGSSFSGICSYRNTGLGWTVHISNTGALRCFSGSADNASSSFTTSSVYWTPVAFLWNASTVTFKAPGRSESHSVQKADSTSVFTVGGWGNGAVGGLGRLADIRAYTRLLSNKEIDLYFSRPGIAYELAPRKRTYSIPPAPGGFQPYWATQRSQMIGGGVR
jgi:hypothetical protein